MLFVLAAGQQLERSQRSRSKQSHATGSVRGLLIQGLDARLLPKAGHLFRLQGYTVNDETKRAILVVGPESSGTRLMTAALIAAGCTGDATHEQRFDESPPHQRLIVWRRSYPHFHDWPNSKARINRLRDAGYDVAVAVMSRDWHCMSASQVRSRHVPDRSTALSNIRRAYVEIFEALRSTTSPFVVVSYESLAHYREAALKRTLAEFGLKPAAIEIRDANRKYFHSAALHPVAEFEEAT